MGGEIWDEPVRGETFPPHLLGLSGIGQLRLFLDGKAAAPPVSHLTGTYPAGHDLAVLNLEPAGAGGVPQPDAALAAVPRW